MIAAFELAGFFAAHAIRCAADRESLVPMLAYTTADDERKMERLVRQQNVSPVAVGQKRLAANDMHGTNAALLYEGRIPVGKETLDAVIIEVRAYSHPDLPATIAVPYTPAASGQFRVHMPKLLVWNDSDQKMAAAMEAFFGGIAANAEGARIWNSSLDESK